MIPVIFMTTVVTNIFVVLGSMFLIPTKGDFIVTGFDMPTVRTALSGRIETICENECFSKLFSLVFHKLTEATEKGTMKVFSLLFHLHAFYIQVLNHDSIELTIQVSGKLVK